MPCNRSISFIVKKRPREDIQKPPPLARLAVKHGTKFTYHFDVMALALMAMGNMLASRPAAAISSKALRVKYSRVLRGFSVVNTCYKMCCKYVFIPL